MKPRTLFCRSLRRMAMPCRRAGRCRRLHRREKRFELGSEIAVFPRHGPLLVRLPIAPLRYYKAGERVHLAVGGGFAEVLKDRVLVVTPRVERVAPTDQRPLASAGAICRRWRQEAVDSRERMVGYA